MNPNHGLFCQSRTYRTKCWDCRAPIYVYQCSCGSVVLFDRLGSGWPLHTCGRASLSPPRPILSDAEWERREFKAWMEAIQPGSKQWISVPAEDHRQSPPLRFVATLQVLPQQTKRISSLDRESQFELAAMEVRSEAKSYAQVTLRDTAPSPHRVYPAIVKWSDLPAGRLRLNMRVGVILEARGLKRAEWFVVEMVALPETAPGELPAA